MIPKLSESLKLFIIWYYLQHKFILFGIELEEQATYSFLAAGSASDLTVFIKQKNKLKKLALFGRERW